MYDMHLFPYCSVFHRIRDSYVETMQEQQQIVVQKRVDTTYLSNFLSIKIIGDRHHPNSRRHLTFITC